MGSVVGCDSASVEAPQSFGEVGQPFCAGINSVESCRWVGDATHLTCAGGGTTYKRGGLRWLALIRRMSWHMQLWRDDDGDRCKYLGSVVYVRNVSVNAYPAVHAGVDYEGVVALG